MKPHVLDAVNEELLKKGLYHVTYYDRLPSIAEVGLIPGQSRAIGSPGYDAHVRGKTFLTEADGIAFWMGRAEAFAEHVSDNVLEDGLVPVVLRVDPDCDGGRVRRSLEVDPLGTRDANADAWMTKRRIDPDCIDAFTGQTWEPIDDAYDAIDPALAFDADPVPEDEQDEYGEPAFYYMFKYESPFDPHEP